MNRHEYRRMLANETPEEREAREARQRAEYGYDSSPEDDTPEERAARERGSREGAREMDQIVADNEAGDSLADEFGLTNDYADAERVRSENSIDRLRDEGGAPSVEDLTPDYSLLPESEAGGAYADKEMIEAQRRALEQLEQWGRGEMTEADFGRRDLTRRALAQDERGQREAVTRGFQERGLGGAGLEVMGQLGAQQGMADRLSAQDTALNVAVQDRALRAIEAAGGLSSRGRDQSFGESYQRGSAVDRFNAANTDIRNRREDRRTDAERDVYQNTEDLTALELGQYNRQADSDREDRDRRTNAVGEGVDWLSELF